VSKDRNPEPQSEPEKPAEGGLPLEELADHPIGAALYELIFDRPPIRKPERRRK
jgi:hypothetical protein